MGTTYLKRTPSSPGSNTTGTVSAWIKYNVAGDYNTIIGGNEGSSSTDRSLFSIAGTTDGAIYNQIVDGGSNYYQESTRRLRDPGAWYHIVYQFDTTNVTQADRIKTYVNNELVDDWQVTASWPSGVDIKLWDSAASAEYMIGCRKSSSSYQYFFNGSMAHVYVIDGTVYPPSTFAETDATSGLWVAKQSVSVTYGTNGGFYKFASGASGTDSAGSNDMTVVGSLTNLKDSPDNNYASWNPLNNSGNASYGIAYSDNNSTITPTAPDANGSRPWSSSTLAMPAKGKWYAEFKLIEGDGVTQIGIGSAGIVSNRLYYNNAYGATTECLIWQPYAGSIIYNNGDLTTGLTAASTGDIIGIAVDCDNEKMYCYLNGSLLNSGGESYTSKVTQSQILFVVGDNTTSGYDEVQANFGNGYFSTTAVTSAGTSSTGDTSVWEYDCPADYYGLNTKNIGNYG